MPGYRSAARPARPKRSINGRYSDDKRFNSFLAAFPMDDPQYVVLVVLDEPKPEKPGCGATAGSNAAPTVAAHHSPRRRRCSASNRDLGPEEPPTCVSN